MKKNIKNIRAPLKEDEIKKLRCGDQVLMSGTIYTARDQAHLRMSRILDKCRKLPLDVKGQVIYYCGPTPKGKRAIGSCGPTTSSRMDGFTPALLTSGLKGMIGKGKRSDEVRRAIKKEKAVYFIAPAGAGAYLSGKVKSSEIVAFDELGPEAIYRLEIEGFPLIVCIDSRGEDIYSEKTSKRKRI